MSKGFSLTKSSTGSKGGAGAPAFGGAYAPSFGGAGQRQMGGAGAPA